MTHSSWNTVQIRSAFVAMLIAVTAVPVTSFAAEFEQCGKASWYKLRGKTASGEQADPGGLTAAHRVLPFGTMVTVTNLANGRSVTVRINDRGPFAKGRVIDVTQAAAQKLGFIQKGIAHVKIAGPAPKSGKLPPDNCQ